MASREEPAGLFDHGAQYFTARDPRFKSAITGWLRAGVVAEWRARIVRVTNDSVIEARENGVRYVGYPRMDAIGGYVARGLKIGYERPITRLERVDTGWTLRFEDGSQTLPYSRVVIAVPAPQAADLLDVAKTLRTRVADIRMAPCWAAMVQFDKPLDARFDAAIVEDEPIAWLARESSKPGRKAGERWVMHASSAWTGEHLEAKPEAVITDLMKTFCELVEKRVSPASGVAHQWLYALAPDAVAGPCLYDPALGLGACGDWLVSGRIESAFVSGLALASEIIQQADQIAPPAANAGSA